MILDTLFPDTSIAYQGYRKIAFPRPKIWEWMLTHPVELLGSVDFHERVEPPALPLAKGDKIMIHHAFPLGYRESRYARINKLAPFVIGFGEVALPGVYDYFPHSYRFRLAELDADTTVVGLDLRGRFQIPGGRVLWMPWFRLLSPFLMENTFDRLEAAVREGLG